MRNPFVISILLSGAFALHACVHAKKTAEPALPAPDEFAFAVSSMPTPPAAPPVAKPAWIKRTEARGITDKDGTIRMNVASVQPLYQDGAKTDTVFTQVNVASSAQTETPSGASSVGLGYRRLIERDLMVGVNGFYDRDWARGLDRTGADAELRWRAFNLSTNYYAGQGNADGEGAFDGYDIRIASQVPYLPWAQTTLTRSDFFTDDGTVSENYSVGMKMDLVKYVQLEAGMRGDGTSPDAGLVKLSVNLVPTQWEPRRRTAFGTQPFSQTAWERRDLRAATLDRVRRDNAILVEN